MAQFIQTKKALDKCTLRKILKGFLYSGISAIIVFCIAYSRGLSLNSAIIIAVGAFGSALVNIYPEYRKGE